MKLKIEELQALVDDRSSELSEAEINLATRGANISAAKLGISVPLTDSTKEKIIAATRRRVAAMNIEEKRKMIEAALRSGPGVFTPERLEKMRLASTGRIHSQETKIKRSKALMGRAVTKETRDKIGRANSGRILSKETKDKISATKIARGAVGPRLLGVSNGNFGMVWIYLPTSEYRSIKIKGSDLDWYLVNGWKLGRVSNVIVETIKAIELYGEDRVKLSKTLNISRRMLKDRLQTIKKL